MLKWVIFILFAAILFNLGRGLFYLVRGRGQSGRVLKSLGWRVGISVGLVLMLMLGAALGWIAPHGVAL